jgi:beta-mannosidase
MQTQTLNGFWQVRRAGTQDWLPASVPGGIHTDLMAAGKLPDPFQNTNEEKVQWVAEKNWEYRRYFYPLPGIFRQEKIWLVCDGLDTLAEVRLNGKILGQTDNMYRSWRWEVHDLLNEGENRLEILFRSPLAYLRARERVKPMRDMNMGIRGGPHLRKVPSHFGWDWGPRLPCMGIWQEIRLEGHSHGRLGDVCYDQEHTPGMVRFTARVQSEIWEETGARHTLRLRITGPERQVWQLDAPARPNAVMTVTIANPQLWWPNGYGAQTLYRVELELLNDEDQILDARSHLIGLRHIELRQEEDTHGHSFTFVVNGVPIFCKGSNWIPADSFPTRVTPRQLETLIRSAAQANHNMLRVWGGGYYESDTFYDLCDQYGILVWQDFQFACATHPLDDPAYLNNVRREVIENVRRLRHHASLALWCGNNEIEWLGTRLGWFNGNSPVTQAYQNFFFHQLPQILAEEDPAALYWPGSPSSNDPFQQPNSDRVGDAHLWEVYHEYRQPKFYRQQNPRFVSEFGFQSLPAMPTVEEFAPPEARRLDSKVMRLHQRAISGNPKLIWYLAQRFKLPKDFDDFIYVSQVFQAEAVRTGIEHWRRHPERTSGTLYWQLNDCWPVISWSSIDYYGRWKALHYLARRFYAPVLLSVEDHVEGGARKMDVWVSNDGPEAWQGRIHWRLETVTGEEIEGGDQTVSIQPQSAACAVKLDFARHHGKVNWKKMVFIAELWQGTERRGIQVVPFLPEKAMSLPAPEIQVEVEPSGEQAFIHLKAKSLARFVELSLPGEEIIFSDNYFDIPAGRVETVACVLPTGWAVEQVQEKLRVRALNDLGPCDSALQAAWKSNLALAGNLLELFWKFMILPVFTSITRFR